MAEIGTVIKVNDNRVTVCLERTEACAKCRACSVGMTSKTMEIECINVCGADVDDKVEITLESDNFLKAVVIMYTVPLIAFMVGTIGGFYVLESLNVSNKEPLSFLIGAFLVLVTYLLIRSRESAFKKGNYIPKAVKIHKQTD